ncbi:MAG: thioredoxin family protein [Leptolyngbyaceae cyanobacterium SL_1_1]|nr:thioredoxin family protein [Leptolyngbyaceae cyanobacterium RM1_1_2]NJO09969.1 thioredoxin family protein [Leptolyngbyaceae cyanobacterium SL_1_1]
MDQHLLQRRRLLGYLGLGILGVGAATLLHRRKPAELPQQPAKAQDVPAAKATAPLPAGMNLPEFQGISQWLNSDPLTVADLRGNVVMIQFWTFACINCQRTLPHVTRWHQQYAASGLKIIGVHTPEFAFEREVGNIETALREHQITYPVPLDNEFATWRAYSNRFWPHLFLADREGGVRYDHIGEGAYDETEQTIRQLLA